MASVSTMEDLYKIIHGHLDTVCEMFSVETTPGVEGIYISIEPKHDDPEAANLILDRVASLRKILRGVVPMDYTLVEAGGICTITDPKKTKKDKRKK